MESVVITTFLLTDLLTLQQQRQSFAVRIQPRISPAVSPSVFPLYLILHVHVHVHVPRSSLSHFCISVLVSVLASVMIMIIRRKTEKMKRNGTGRDGMGGNGVGSDWTELEWFKCWTNITARLIQQLDWTTTTPGLATETRKEQWTRTENKE